MRRCWRYLAMFVILIALVAFISLFFVYRGYFNVAATSSDLPIVAWFLGNTMDHSVSRHAADIQVPALDDPAMMRLGFQHYRGMCVECHAAPGVKAEELAKGLNPDPPELAESIGDWEPNEIFWITKHGVRMTGMPAWGPTHSDKEIWAMVSFVRKLPTMKPDEYRKMDRGTPPLVEN
jgi:mono/diheme cytochrome c family protein